MVYCGPVIDKLIPPDHFKRDRIPCDTDNSAQRRGLVHVSGNAFIWILSYHTNQRHDRNRNLTVLERHS